MGRRVSTLMRHRTAALGTVLGVVAITALTGTAWADRLEPPAEAPWWIHAGAAALLYSHIGGGTVGLISGAIALAARKGGKAHRAAGNVFFVAMLVMAGIGGAVAPFLQDRISTVAGLMTFYLIATAWLTARRRGGVSGWEVAGLFVAIGGLASTLTLLWLARQTPEGTLDGSPPQAFYIFAVVSFIAAASDLKLILRGGISGAQRIARHVWRMCFGLFVASGSLFLGQMQLFPAWLRDTPVLYVAALAPLLFLMFWVFHVRLSKRFRAPEPA